MGNITEKVDLYVFNKAELDNQKELCDRLNKEIKDMMIESNIVEAFGTEVVAKLIVQNRESVDEDKMLEILKANWTATHGTETCPYIKTRYYVDMDELEKAIYHGDLNTDTLVKLDSCKTVTPVKTLRLSKRS